MGKPGGILRRLASAGLTWTLGIFLALLLGLPFVIYSSLSEHAEDESLRLARSFSSTISTFRSYYTRNVAARVIEGHGQIVLTERYKDFKGGIPIPATLSIELGEILREKSEQSTDGSFSFSFVSDMPFLNRDRRPLDNFQESALRKFRQEIQSTEYWAIDSDPSVGNMLRLAIPVRMEAGCVACHNGHPDSPLKTWKVGDVRGIQDVSVGMSVGDQGKSSLFLGVYLLVFLGSGGLAFREAIRSNATLEKMYENKVASEAELNQKKGQLEQNIIELAVKTAVIDKAPFGIAIADFQNNDLRLSYANYAFSAVTEYSSEELVGRSFRLFQGPKTDAQQVQKLKGSLIDRKTIELDLEIYKRSGSTAWIRGLFFPTYDQSGQFQHFIITVSDISQLKSSEEEKLRLAGELQESLKLESLGLTIAGIAHDLNTPIGISITASSHLRACLDELKVQLQNTDNLRLKESLEDLEDASSLINTNLNKAASLVASFKKTSADATRTEWQDTNLKAFFDTLVVSLSPITKRAGCEVSLNVPSGLSLFTEPGSLSQVVMNLIVNATIHAFGPVGDRRIDIAAEESDQKILITIADNGMGMPDDVVAKVFTPFFTTKRSSGGSGLGLFSAKRTAESVLGGRLTFKSEIGKGTAFTLELPRTNEI